MKALLALITLTLLCTGMAAQDGRAWEQTLASMMTAEDMESEEWEDTYEMLCELEQHPLNLNTATREELEALPFLTERQVEAIMEYLYYYAPMKSLNELRMISGLDYPQITLLRCFCQVDTERTERGFPKLNDITRYGSHELTASARVPFYRRKGDDNGYLGYPYRHSLRYQFSYGDYVKLGAVGSQDAGEPFLSKGNKAGYDFYSYYLQVKHLGRAENIVAGKYRLSTGMGLVLNNSFGMGKLAMLQQLGRSSHAVRPHSSRSQSGFFQGAAATVRLSARWLLTSFLSYRPQDATLNSDGTASTLLTSGYHRTQAEMDKKNNTHATDAGAHIAYRQGGLHAGATAVYTHLDRKLQPNTATLYRRHYAQGQDFVNLSADYGYLHHRFALNGETAMNRHGAVATINSLSVNASDELRLMLLQRFYSYRYTALYARSISEGGHVQNESGIYLGLTWQPTPRLRLQAYTDYAYFAWARYQASLSSQAWDNLLTATYSRPAWSLTGRYRLHLRQKDNDEKTMLTNQYEHRGRIAFNWHGQNRIALTTQADGVMSSGSGREWGYMLTQSASAQWHGVRLNAGAGYFRTTSYDSRLYTYERGPLYSFSFPAYYGEGLRLSLMVNAALGRQLTATAKAGYTHYTDRSTIGSGLQQTDGPTQTDLDLQLRWKF